MPWRQLGNAWQHDQLPYLIRAHKLEVDIHAVRYTIHSVAGDFLAARWRLAQATAYCEEHWRQATSSQEETRPRAGT